MVSSYSPSTPIFVLNNKRHIEPCHRSKFNRMSTTLDIRNLAPATNRLQQFRPLAVYSAPQFIQK